MLLSDGQMAELRVALPRLGAAMNWLEMQDTGLDLDHVVFFALLGALLRVLLPRMGSCHLLAGLAVLAVATELLQFGAVGRTPNLLDVRDDLIGAVCGMALGALSLGGTRRLLALWGVSQRLSRAAWERWPARAGMRLPMA